LTAEIVISVGHGKRIQPTGGFNLNSMVQHPVARVLQKLINLHRTQLQSFLFILFLTSTTRHVSAHPQV
jgi:hypothetical protein